MSLQSSQDLVGRALRYRSAGGDRLYTQGFSVRPKDLTELHRLAASLDCSPLDAMTPAIELLTALDNHALERLIWLRETVAIPHRDAWAGIEGERGGPCFARLTPEDLAALSACARRHEACLDRAAAAAINTLSAVHRLVSEGFHLAITQPIALPVAVRPRPRVAYSAA